MEDVRDLPFPTNVQIFKGYREQVGAMNLAQAFCIGRQTTRIPDSFDPPRSVDERTSGKIQEPAWLAMARFDASFTASLSQRRKIHAASVLDSAIREV